MPVYSRLMQQRKIDAIQSNPIQPTTLITSPPAAAADVQNPLNKA